MVGSREKVTLVIVAILLVILFVSISAFFTLATCRFKDTQVFWNEELVPSSGLVHRQSVSSTPHNSSLHFQGEDGTSRDQHEDHVCTFEGVHGYINSSALVSIIVSPKNLAENAFNSGGELHLKHVFWSWRQLRNVNVVVMSQHCSVLKLARSLGLPTLLTTSGSDVGDLTYRHAFQTVEETCNTPIVGYCNADIAFDESLVETLQALMDYRSRNKSFERFMIVGRRTNANVPENLFIKDGPISDTAWNRIKKFIHANGTLFQTNAQDFFLFTKPLGVTWSNIPAFIVGGIYFDNWFTSFIEKRSAVQEIDVTKTMWAMHINHGKGTHKSHANVASTINALIGKSYAIHGGHTTDATWVTERRMDGSIAIRNRKLK